MKSEKGRRRKIVANEEARLAGVEVTVKNYRCFTDESPATIRFLPGGFVALVGPNNAGKSALLKLFHDLRTGLENISTPTGLANALSGHGPFTHPDHLLGGNSRLFTYLNDRPLRVTIRPLGSTKPPTHCPAAKEIVIDIPRLQGTVEVRLGVGGKLHRVPQASATWDACIYAARTPVGYVEPICAACRSLAHSMFIGPFRNALNVNPGADYFDIRVGAAFINAWTELKTRPDRDGNRRAHGVAEDIKDVFRLRDLPDISAQTGSTAIVFYKNGEAHTLEELGSGITQFLLTLANAAIKKPSYILIDEPELGLHPSLQIDFLTTLASYATDGVVFATHNIGLARATADRIYSVRQDPDGTSEVRDFDDDPHLAEFLGAMCFAGYRDLGCRTVLLVEGTTEVRTMQQFLRMWKKDHQVVILPLGGSSLIGPGRTKELAGQHRRSCCRGHRQRAGQSEGTDIQGPSGLQADVQIARHPVPHPEASRHGELLPNESR